MKLNLNDKYYQKYIKYKNKYITLKKQNNNNDLEGGMFESLYNLFTTKPKSPPPLPPPPKLRLVHPQKDILFKLLEMIKTIIRKILTEKKFFLYKDINNIFSKNTYDIFKKNISISDYNLNDIKYYNLDNLNNNLLQELEKLDMLDNYLLIKYFIKIKNKDINIKYSKTELIDLILNEKQLELNEFFKRPYIIKNNINKYNYVQNKEEKFINMKQLEIIFNELDFNKYHLTDFENILSKNLLNYLINFNILQLSNYFVNVILNIFELDNLQINKCIRSLHFINDLNNNHVQLFNIFDNIMNIIEKDIIFVESINN